MITWKKTIGLLGLPLFCISAIFLSAHPRATEKPKQLIVNGTTCPITYHDDGSITIDTSKVIEHPLYLHQDDHGGQRALCGTRVPTPTLVSDAPEK